MNINLLWTTEIVDKWFSIKKFFKFEFIIIFLNFIMVLSTFEINKRNFRTSILSWNYP